MSDSTFKRVLVSMDDSETSRAALDTALAMLGGRQAEVTVLTVVPKRGSEAEVARHLESAQRLVADAAALLASRGLTATGTAQLADADQVANVIAETARKLPADLVVMGTRGRSSLAGALLGSVSHAVMSMVDCPLLLVRPTARHLPVSAPRRITVAISGEEDKEEIVAAATALAREDTEVLVVHRLEAVVGVEGAAYLEPEGDAREAVDAVVKAINERGIRARGQLSRSLGSTARTIAEVAEEFDSDLIVIGSRRLSDLAGFISGSVSHQVAHVAAQPVLVAARGQRH